MPSIPIVADRFYVYEHLTVDSGSVFYVGKGTGKRAYIANHYHRNQHWLRHVAKHGGFSVRIVASSVSEEFAFLVEIERIDQLRRQGVRLCNQTDGGDGAAGWIKSESWRQKVGAKHKGKVLSAETRAKISASVKSSGFVYTDEMRRRISDAKKGNKNSLGKKHTDEWKKQASVRALGNKSRSGQTRSAEERAKASASLSGRIQPKVQCPHCQKIGGNVLMSRYHFDNCEKKQV